MGEALALPAYGRAPTTPVSFLIVNPRPLPKGTLKALAQPICGYNGIGISRNSTAITEFSNSSDLPNVPLARNTIDVAVVE